MRFLDIKTEIDHIGVLYDIVFAFEAQFSRFLAFRFAAESDEVQSDNLIAVKSESALKKLLQGTFANNETRGATITTAAAVARVLVASPNFTLRQNPLLARISLLYGISSNS